MVLKALVLSLSLHYSLEMIRIYVIAFCISLALLPCTVVSAEFDLDIDDDGETAALTDGLLVIRYLFGFSGESLIVGAVSNSALRSNAGTIENYLSLNKTMLDVDGNGQQDALTDGLLVIRSLFGFTGEALTAGAVAGAAARGEAIAVQTYLESILDSDNDGVVNSRDGYPNISLGGRQDSDGDGFPDECDADCLAVGLTKDLETTASTPTSTTPATPGTGTLGTFIWDTHNWDEQTWH